MDTQPFDDRHHAVGPVDIPNRGETGGQPRPGTVMYRITVSRSDRPEVETSVTLEPDLVHQRDGRWLGNMIASGARHVDEVIARERG